MNYVEDRLRPEWDSATLTVEAVALGGCFKQAIVLGLPAPWVTGRTAKELIGEVKRAIRTMGGWNSPPSVFVIGQSDGGLNAHIIFRHRAIDQRTLELVAKMSGFEIKEVRDISDLPARPEVRRMLQLPLRRVSWSQDRAIHSKRHFDLNDDRWVWTLGDFFWDGTRKLKGISEARELAAKSLGWDGES